MDIEIVHDKVNRKFYAVVDGREAYLYYEMPGTDRMNMLSTYVPRELRGRGIAGKIVEEALKYAEKNSFKVLPSCSYVEDYLYKHDEYGHLRI